MGPGDGPCVNLASTPTALPGPLRTCETKVAAVETSAMGRTYINHCSAVVSLGWNLQQTCLQQDVQLPKIYKTARTLSGSFNSEWKH